MTTKFVRIPMGMLVLIALILIAMGAATTGDKQPYRKHYCSTFTSGQEETILSIGRKLLEYKDYPLMADRATRFAYLAARGVTDPTVMANFQATAGYLHQTIYEISMGNCWEADNDAVFLVLKELKELWGM